MDNLNVAELRILLSTVSDPDVNWKEICLEIAANHPRVFVNATLATGFHGEVGRVAASSKIDAIRMYREYTGATLRDAKIAVEQIMEATS